MKSSMMPEERALPPVDLVINTFERTYRTVLRPGFIQEIARSNQFTFARRIVLLNNIGDMNQAREFATQRRDDGEIDDYYCVSDYLDQALRVVDIRLRDLGSIAYYSTWAFVALVIPGNHYMVHWDAELEMANPCDWITPCLRLMLDDQRIAVANPLWSSGVRSKECRERRGDFILSYGFSDQLYLLDRREFARPIYRHWVPISARYPLSHIAPYFEQMVDAYLRVNKRFRATWMLGSYEHPKDEGVAYPASLWASGLDFTRRTALFVMRRFPGCHPYFHD